MEECPICLEALQHGTLCLQPCGHSLHASCFCAAQAEAPLHAWRCPCCRAAVDVGCVLAGADLPAECRGLLYQRRDAEACSSRRSSADQGAPVAPGPLTSLSRFVSTASRALREERLAAGSSRCCPLGSTQQHSPGWALHAAERLLPTAACRAAATALASVRLRQLLAGPKAAPSLAMAAASWMAAALALLAGCVLGAALLAAFLRAGMRLQCCFSACLAAALGLAPQCGCQGCSYDVPLLWIVALICGVAALVALDTWRAAAASPGLWPLVLRLDLHARWLLLRLLGAAFSVAAGMLAGLFLLTCGWLVGAWLSELLADPPGAQPAWRH